MAPLLAALACGRSHHPNVMLIVVDALRKDHLHTYGHPLSLSPAIDALGADGVVFENHLAHASQTIPSTLSLFLSRLPADHGFMPVSLDVPPTYFPPELLFLTEVLHDHGYATAGFMANPLLGPDSGFEQGFDHFAYLPGRGDELTRAATEWLAGWSQRRDRPFFVYLHYMDVHQPYDPPEAFKRRFHVPEQGIRLGGNRHLVFADPVDLAYTRALYAAAVAYADEQAGGMIRELEALGVRQDTIVVVTADHGEELGDHGGLGHGTSVYGELVRVPMILSYPGHVESGRRVRQLTRHLDVAPTLLRLAGIDPPAAFRGGSLFAPLDRVFVEMGPWVGVYTGDWKLVWNRDTGERTVFSTTDQLDQEPRSEAAVASRLAPMAESYVAGEVRVQPQRPKAADWTSGERERLRALGYAR